MNRYFSAQEIQPSLEREQQLLSQLTPLINYAKQECEYYAKSLADIDASKIDSRAQLATLPIIRKSDLIDMQQRQAPFAGLNARAASVDRIFQSPGPINDP